MFFRFLENRLFAAMWHVEPESWRKALVSEKEKVVPPEEVPAANFDIQSIAWDLEAVFGKMDGVGRAVGFVLERQPKPKQDEVPNEGLS